MIYLLWTIDYGPWTWTISHSCTILAYHTEKQQYDTAKMDYSF